MKVQCDVCSHEEASLFCSADEAALCHGCDLRIHQANKLAGKHHRFSLLPPSSPISSPLCDICKEKKAFLFCQEDRAILCRDCDLPIHSASEHTGKHNRFLLTGVRLSLSSPAPEMAKAGVSPATIASSGKESREESCAPNGTISEYLIKTIPGWHVEELLQDSTHASHFSPCFSKQAEKGDDYLLSFVESDLEHDMSGFGREQTQSFSTWVPQVPQFNPQQMLSAPLNVEARSWKDMNSINSTRSKWWREEADVPQKHGFGLWSTANNSKSVEF